MPAQRVMTRMRLFLPLVAVGVGGMGLAGCSGSDDAMGPPCPQVSISDGTGDVRVYRPTGHDLTDLQLTGRVEGIHGVCKPATKGMLAARMTVNFSVVRGPASTRNSADVPYFVAVMKGGEILDKKLYSIHVDFPPNTDTVRPAGEQVDLALPLDAKTSGASYTVLAGFQLTPDELAYNRAHPER